MMISTKPWYLSRTIWASIVTMLMAAVGLLGLPADGVDASALTDAILQSVTALAGLAALIGRFRAKDRIE